MTLRAFALKKFSIRLIVNNTLSKSKLQSDFNSKKKAQQNKKLQNLIVGNIFFVHLHVHYQNMGLSLIKLNYSFNYIY